MKDLFLGLDVGSTASKCVIITQDGDIASKGMYPAGSGTVGPQTCVEEALTACAGGASLDDVRSSCATGYGRKLSDWTDIQMSELSCHARGAVELFDGVRTVIDIGGQDAKVLSIGKDGKLENFAMNDKCAAGTGKFIEVMANRLGLTIEELFELAEIGEPIAISSLCTVFAESEVISLIARKYDRRDILSGMHLSMAKRIIKMMKKSEKNGDVLMTGGGALNIGLRKAFEDELMRDVFVANHPQFNGAIGAALLASERG